MLTLYTEPQENRRAFLASKTGKDAMWFVPKISPSSKINYKAIADFLFNHVKDKELVLWLPETGLGSDELKLLVCNILCNIPYRDRSVHLATDSNLLLDWIRAFIRLEFIDYRQVVIYHDGYHYPDYRGMLKSWPSTLQEGVTDATSVILCKDIVEARQCFEDIRTKYNS